MRNLLCLAMGIALAAPAANAAVIYADTVLDYYHSGSEVFAPGFGYGGPPDASTVPLSYAVDGNPNTFISLPTGSYIVLGFSTGFVFDGAGDDLFVDETGDGREDAELWLSSDYGNNFTLLTTVFGNRTNSLDFSDFGFTGTVNAIKLVGLDRGGSSPGFDITGVWGLEGSTVEEPQGPSAVPLPASFPILFSGIAALGWVARKRRKTKQS